MSIDYHLHAGVSSLRVVYKPNEPRTHELHGNAHGTDLTPLHGNPKPCHLTSDTGMYECRAWHRDLLVVVP